MRDDDITYTELDYGNEKDTKKKIKYVDENLWSKLEKTGNKISFAKDIVALYKYMKDPFVGLGRKAIVVTALIYFITPIDAIPDFIPVVGFLDDLGVLAGLLKFLGSELVPYYETR